MITKKNDFCVVYDDFSTIHAAFIFLLITVFYSEVPDNVIFSRNICWRKSVVSFRLLQSFRQLLPKNNIGSVLEKYIFFETWERFLLGLCQKSIFCKLDRAAGFPKFWRKSSRRCDRADLLPSCTLQEQQPRSSLKKVGLKNFEKIRRKGVLSISKDSPTANSCFQGC